MQKLDMEKIRTFFVHSARPVDRALYDYHFGGGDIVDVLAELAKFQNEDGGFGNAIEPDLRLPQSTALGTWMAFQTLKEIDMDTSNELLQCGLKYFVDTYDEAYGGWKIVRPEVNDYPHAPWWTYEIAMKHFGWGNPSAEILGFFLKYDVSGVQGMVASLMETAIKRIAEVPPQSFHEVRTFKALFMMSGEEFRKQIREPLTLLIKKATNENPREWTSYVATPLTFIESPGDPFIDLFEASLFQENIDFIFDNIVDDSHWEPNWDWSETYPNDWEKAKQEWSGYLTVKNLYTLKKFNQSKN